MFFFVLKYAPILNHTVNLKDALERKYFTPHFFLGNILKSPRIKDKHS